MLMCSGISSYFISIRDGIESVRMKTPTLNSMLVSALLLSALLLSFFSPGQSYKCVDLSACVFPAMQGRAPKRT